MVVLVVGLAVEHDNIDLGVGGLSAQQGARHAEGLAHHVPQVGAHLWDRWQLLAWHNSLDVVADGHLGHGRHRWHLLGECRSCGLDVVGHAYLGECGELLREGGDCGLGIVAEAHQATPAAEVEAEAAQVAVEDVAGVAAPPVLAPLGLHVVHEVAEVAVLGAVMDAHAVKVIAVLDQSYRGEEERRGKERRKRSRA